MRYVVVIPFSIYILGFFVALTLGLYAVTIVGSIGFIYLLLRYPLNTIGFLVGCVALKFWYISLPIFLVVWLYTYFSKKEAVTEVVAELGCESSLENESDNNTSNRLE